MTATTTPAAVMPPASVIPPVTATIPPPVVSGVTMSALPGTVFPTIAAEEEKVHKFEFDTFFQSKIAALMLKDLEFVRRIDGLILPQYFENLNEAHLVRIANNYFIKYKRLPADGTIYRNLLMETVEAKIIPKESLLAVVTKLKDLLQADVSDRDYVIDQVATFAKHQAVAKAFEQSIPMLDTRNFESISKLMKTALDTGAHTDTNEYDFAKQLAARTGERLEKAAGKLAPKGITTGYPKFDAAMYHSGWGRGELAVIMGGAKAGKTTALMDFGINAMGAKFNVLYVTLEVSQEIIGNRMDSNISERAIMELSQHIHDVNDKVTKFLSKAGKHFTIFEYPTGSMTVTDLRRLIERQRGKGIIYDLVIVDYADLMQPDRYTDNMIENSKSVYVALRGLAMQEKFAILTATQTNRVGSTAAVAKAEHVADDFNKIRIADIVISINRTDEEKAQKQARLYFAACRNSPSGYSIRVKQELDRMKFISEVVGEE
jgi:replicative DNA helicase